MRILVCLVFATAAFCQTAVVKRNVTLRPDASTDNEAIMTLKSGTRVKILQSTKKNGYLSVLVGVRKGWVWANSLNIDESGGEAISDDDDFSPDTTDDSGGDEDNTDNCIEGNSAGIVHVGPERLYPESNKTPGCAATLTTSDLTKRYTENCPRNRTDCTYSQAHRRVSSTERKAIYDSYEVPQEGRSGKIGEVDHFYPLCAGGSNDQKNLWYQPTNNEWMGKNFGFHEKDKLEQYICKEVKAHRMEPKDAFERITKDWVKFYLDEGLDKE